MTLRTCVLLPFLACLAFGNSDPPLDILFMLDVSQNMADPAAFVTAGARLATFELSPNDRVAVMSFSSGAKLQAGFTSDAGEIGKALTRSTRTIVRRSGKRCLYDALTLALEQFPAKLDPSRRRVVAVITNDVDQGSTRAPADIIRDAGAKGVAVWGFLMASPYPDRFQQKNGYPGTRYPDVQFAAKQLQPLAKETGGKVVIRDTNGYVLRYAIAACKGEE